MVYTYATLFYHNAEKAFAWLTDNAEIITPPRTVKEINGALGRYSGDYIFIRYKATPEIYEAFADYMGFIYAK